ncbi:hypothetical protein [Sporosarcina koreensis]|uniref:hypothetical protein n=1 Tax=Sporosarcina koreensis TaxID=334735 RepID=UPI00075BEAB9|nr:hypothetical protein [Sporosarcina koreensis]
MNVFMRRKRMPDGTFGDLEKVFEGDTDAEKIARLQEQNTMLMLALTDLYEHVYAADEEATK